MILKMTHHISVSHIRNKLTELDGRTISIHFGNFRDQYRLFQTLGTNSAQWVNFRDQQCILAFFNLSKFGRNQKE